MAATMVTVNGAAIRAARTSAGLPATVLAEQAGITKGHLSNIEHGRRPTVRRIVVRAIADTLNVDPDALLAA